MARKSWVLAVWLVCTILLASCGTPEAAEEPVVVKETVVVEKEVVVEATVVVEKEVVVEVEKTVVVEATPEPAAAPDTTGSRYGGTIVYGVQSCCPDSMDQDKSGQTSCRIHARQVLETLTVVDPTTGIIYPGLATSWEISDDGLEITFHLRQGVMFHDGTPFNAEAVKYNLDRTQSLPPKAAWGYMGGDKFKEAVVLDEYTVKVVFNEPYSGFIPSLSDAALGIDSPTAIEKYGEDYGVTALVGTGPFMFSEWVKDDHMTFVRNPDYNWAPELFKHQGPAYLETYECREIPEPSSLAAALEIGEVDIARVAELDVATFRAAGGFNIKLIPKAGTTRMFFMNTQKWPTSELIFRQAVLYAIDKEAIVNAPYFSGIGSPGVAPLPSNMIPGGADEFAQLSPPYDPEKAQALLDEFGCVDSDGDGLREKDGESCKVVFILHPTELGFVQPAEGMLRAVGIDVEMLQGDWPVNMEAALKGDHNLYLISDSGYIAASMLWGFFHSTAPYNVAHYSNPELDMHLEAGLTTMDEAAKWEHIKAALRIIMADAVTVDALEVMYPFVMDDKLQDVFFSELGYPVAYDIWLQE